MLKKEYVEKFSFFVRKGNNLHISKEISSPTTDVGFFLLLVF